MTGEPAGARQVVQVESGYGYGAVGASVHVFQDRGPVYLLTEHRPPQPAGAEWLPAQPSRMLDARHQVVEFAGRRKELDDLAEWRDSAARRLSVRWLHAPGGQGKTRLADEFAARSQAAGWKAVDALHGPTAQIVPSPGSQDLRLRHERGLLLVIDYADRWPTSHLKWLFGNALLHQSVPTRVLLLARSAQPWPVLRAALTKVGADGRAQTLAPLSDGIGERERMFTAARDCFAARYGLAAPTEVRVPGSLSLPEFGLVLAVHMAALAAVDAHVHGVRPPEDLAGLSSYLLAREQDHWQVLYEAAEEGKDYATRPAEMAHTVFVAALTGARTYERGAALLRGLDLRSDPYRRLTDHAVCYPPTDPGTALEPLCPDRLAEDYLALAFPGHSVAGEHPPVPWAAFTAQALAARTAQGEPPAHISRLITFLASAAGPGRWPHLAPHLGALVRADPALVVAAGSAALTAVANVTGLDPAALEAVEAHFPRGRDADLDPGVAAVAARLARHRLADATNPVDRIHVNMTLAGRQSHAGLHEDALAAQDQAVALLEELVAHEPQSAEPVLAVTLNDRGVTLLALRRWRAAVADERRAADLYRRLALSDPRTYEPSLAVALSHVGVGLSHLGRHQEALDAELEAVEILERFAAAEPGRYESELAASLSNLGTRLSEAGSWQDALPAAERSVAVRRRLAREDPGQELPGLARSLSNLGQRLRDLGRWEEGLGAEQEAVEIFEQLVRANPVAYETAFARSVANLATHLAHCGRHLESLARAEQALVIRRRLAEAAPDAHGLELAESLAGFGSALAEVGRHEEALASATEAVRRLRDLTETEPAVHRDRLARALATFAKVSLDGGHDLAPALTASNHALEIYLELRAQDGRAYEPFIAAVLGVHADLLRAAGRTVEADALHRFLRTGDPTEMTGMMFPLRPRPPRRRRE
ncbi:tetratricopeptide repeat protein [Streptomyces humi]